MPFPSSHLPQCPIADTNSSASDSSNVLMAQGINDIDAKSAVSPLQMPQLIRATDNVDEI